MVALLKSSKDIYVLIFLIHIPDFIFKSIKHGYKTRYSNLKLQGFIVTYIQLKMIGIVAFNERN